MNHALADRPVFSHREIVGVLSGVVLTLLMGAIDQTIVATALPTMAAQLGGLDKLSWVVTAYLLTSTATTPIYGRLSDLFGRKRMLQIAIAVFLAGSVLCALSADMIQLIVFRAVQGVGGGGLMALSFTVIGDVIAPRERGRYQGYIGGTFALANVIGPLLGGLLTDYLSWQWIFLINVPLGLAALAMTNRALARLPRATGSPRIDYVGSVLMIGAVTGVLFFLSRVGDLAHAPLLIGGAGALGTLLTVAFLIQESRSREPILPLRLFRIPVLAVSAPAIGINAALMFAGIIFVPLNIQMTHHAGATESGLLLLPAVFGITAGAVVGGRLVSATGRYKVYPLVGTAIAIAMFGLMVAVGERMADPLWATALLAPLGVGLGLLMPVLTVASQNAVAPGDLGAATSLTSFSRSLGGTIGVAVIGTIFTHNLAARLEAAGVPGLEPRAVLEMGRAALDPLPEAAQGAALAAVEAAFGSVYLSATVLAAGLFLLLLGLKELPLRSAAGPR
jgi:EmrB/QacA subfamily drug resistance transporter